MTTTSTPTVASLPTPPEIPASNASYNTIIGRIRDAAKHGVKSVEHVRDTVKGTNTYAKMVRRYADAVILALTTPVMVAGSAPMKGTATPKAARKPRTKKVVTA